MPGEKRFLIIGIDEYPSTRYKRIANAKIDGDRFAKVLQERYGFVPVRDDLYDNDATCDNIRDAILDLAESSFEEDNLVIYFAGHGDQNTQSRKGYWIPVDGENDQKKFIKNSTVLDDLESIKAKHILLISDSCYSGTFISRTRTPGKTLTHDELESKNSRWVFVSGEETPVKDGNPGEGSPFGIALCNCLEQNVAPSLSAGDIFDQVIRKVENKGGQQPQADVIRCEAHDGGQMIFRLRINSTTETALPFEPIQFDLPEAKVEYYIPRLLTYYDYQESKEFKFYQPEVGKIYLNSLIRSERRIVILGAAGSGKSVELISQAYKVRDEQEPLNPIFLRFNTYTDQNFADYLPYGWQETDLRNLVLFLDGLDEIQPHYFQTAIRKITAFAQQFPEIKMVVSCRNNFYELPYQNFSGTLEGFAVYNLNDVSIPEIKNYVSDKFALDGEDFVEKILKNAFLDLVQKPFFLNILIKYYKDYGDFGTGRAAIMEEALLKYYINDKQHFLTTIPQLTKTQIFNSLEKIAFVMETVGSNFISEEDLVKVFKTSDEIERCKYLPAFNKKDDEGKWMFEHNNLQEYIASRVLDRKNTEEIIKIISVNTGGQDRVKPSWVNTISFFVSIGKDDIVQSLLNWIIKHDREVIIKFEKERLSETQRIALVKSVFTFYTDKQIWLQSNNFSDKDLARFGESKEILDFLLFQIENTDGNRIAKMNAIHILSNYQIGKFEEYHVRIKAALTGMFNDSLMSANDIYSVLGTIAELKIDDNEVLNLIVERFRNRRNQYIRAGMYKVLIYAKVVDQFVDVFIDGIDFYDLDSPADDRESVNLFDESMLLSIAFDNLGTAQAIEKVLWRLAHSENKRELFMSDYQEIMASLMKKASKLYPEHTVLFNPILAFLIAEVARYRSNIINPIITFFEETKTRWDAFINVWQNDKLEIYDKGLALNHLLNEAMISNFIDYEVSANLTEDEIKAFYDLLIWHKGSDIDGLKLISDFEIGTLKNRGIKLERPQLRDWRQFHKQREQESFDLWFDEEKLAKEVGKVFHEIGKEYFTSDELFNYNNKNGVDIEGRMINSLYLIINHLTMRGRMVSQSEVENYISQSEDFQNFRIRNIHADIINKKNIVTSKKQKHFINTWCIEVGNSQKILWDFINNFTIMLPEEKILDLTNYTNFNYDVNLTEPGSIEQLEKFVSKSKLKDKILENLKNPDLNMLAWTSNVGYALRHNFTTSFPEILNRLEQKYDYEYKFPEILKTWFNKTKDTSRLKELIKNIGSKYLRWEAIRLLEETNSETDYLNSLFHKIIENSEESEDDKIYAANHLMKQNDLYGFYFVTNLIKSNPDPGFDFRLKLGSVSMIKNLEALNTLIELLAIAKRPEFKHDVFNDLEDKVLSALHNIGIQSGDNYLVVKSSIEEFISDYTNVLPNVNFLYYTIVRMEEQLKMKYISAYTIDDAVKEYDFLLS